MPKQEKKTKEKVETQEVVTEELEAKDQQELTDTVDDLLDDIDEVLEVNAAEFVQAYVQKGGQ